MAGYGPRKRLTDSEDAPGVDFAGRKKSRTVNEDPGLSIRGEYFLVLMTRRFAEYL